MRYLSNLIFVSGKGSPVTMSIKGHARVEIIKKRLILTEILRIYLKHILVTEHNVEHALIAVGVKVETILRDLGDDVVELLLFLLNLPFDLLQFFANPVVRLCNVSPHLLK